MGTKIGPDFRRVPYARVAQRDSCLGRFCRSRGTCMVNGVVPSCRGRCQYASVSRPDCKTPGLKCHSLGASGCCECPTCGKIRLRCFSKFCRIPKQTEIWIVKFFSLIFANWHAHLAFDVGIGIVPADVFSQIAIGFKRF